MEKEKSKIMVRDVETQQILLECALTESERAWQFAAEMEEMVLVVEVINPTLSETLSTSLGLSSEEKEKYRQSMEEEMEQHEGSCCFENSDKKVQ
jgi:hypothetical protein